MSHADAVTQQRARNIAGGVAAIGSAFAVAGSAVVSYATDLNEGLANVATLIPGQQERLQELRGDVQELARAYGTPTEGADGGLYEAISAFGDSADTVSILETNTKAAKAGVAEVGEAIALTSAVTKGYNTVNAEGVQRAADLAFKTVELGQTNFPQLAAAIGQVVPISAELGVTQEELFGVMATATGVTGTASQVSTQLRGVLAGLMQPTAAMAGLYADMGVESGHALIEQRGLRGALVAVTDAARASGEPLGKYLGSVEAQTLALTLTGGQQDAWIEKTAAMGDAAGSVDVAFKEQTEGVNASAFALDQYKQIAVTFMQDAGQSIINFSGPLATGLLGVAQFGGAVSGMAPQITAMMATLGGWPGLATKVSTASKAMWAAVGGPVTLIVAGLVALGVAAWTYRDELVGAFRAVLGYIQPWVIQWLAAVETLVGWIPGVGDDLRGMVASARTQLAEFVTVAEEAGEDASAAAGETAVWEEAGTESAEAMATGLRESKAVKKAVKLTAEEAAAALRKTLSSAMQRALDNMDIAAARFTAGPIAGLTATGRLMAQTIGVGMRHELPSVTGQLGSSLITGAPIYWGGCRVRHRARTSCSY